MAGLSPHPAEQDVESSQGTLPRARGSPAGVWNCALKLYTCLTFRNPTAFRADWKSRLSLSPAVLQHFHPACSFLLTFGIYTVTPSWGGCCAARLRCLLLLLGNSRYVSLLVQFCSVAFGVVITVQCLSSELAANIELHGLISCWMLLSIQDFPSLASTRVVVEVHCWMYAGERFFFSLLVFASKKVCISWQNAFIKINTY